MGYLYYGIRRFLLRRLVKRLGVLVASSSIALTFASASGGSHVAVWMGASTPNAQNWVQAGIEQSGGDTHPWEYIEVGKHGQQQSLNEWPTTIGHRAHVSVLRRGSLWQVRIDGHVSRWVYLPGGYMSQLQLLEIYKDGGKAYGVATINGRTVRG